MDSAMLTEMVEAGRGGREMPLDEVVEDVAEAVAMALRGLHAVQVRARRAPALAARIAQLPVGEAIGALETIGCDVEGGGTLVATLRQILADEASL